MKNRTIATMLNPRNHPDRVEVVDAWDSGAMVGFALGVAFCVAIVLLVDVLG